MLVSSLSQNGSCPSQQRVLDAVSHHYGMDAIGADRLSRGEGGFNFRVKTSGQHYFVKFHRQPLNVDAELAAVQLTCTAAAAGVPTATIVPTRDGQLVAVDDDRLLTAWEWVEADPGNDGMTLQQAGNAGEVLGLIHREFAYHPVSCEPSLELPRWMGRTAKSVRIRIDRLHAHLASLPRTAPPDPFDEVAALTLAERSTDLAHLSPLITALPRLTTQVLHGDFSPINLLFNGPHVATVVDFQPPTPFLIAYELGRLAFFPGLLRSHDWLAGAHSVLSGYLRTNAQVAPTDIRACGRVALIQLLTSLYGVEQHYLSPGMFPDRLDRFWIRRHRMARTLLDSLDITDRMLNIIAAGAAT